MIDRNHQFNRCSPRDSWPHIAALELDVGSGGEQQRLFWEDQDGRTTVRRTVKKMALAQNSMKIEFQR